MTHLRLLSLCALLTALVIAGAWLWREQGAMVWLRSAIAYCF